MPLGPPALAGDLVDACVRAARSALDERKYAQVRTAAMGVVEALARRYRHRGGGGDGGNVATIVAVRADELRELALAAEADAEPSVARSAGEALRALGR